MLAIPARLFVPAGEVLSFDVRNANATRGEITAHSVPAIAIATAPLRVAGAPLIHCIGDGLTDRLMPELEAALRKHGLSPEFIGTVDQEGGFQGEARAGKMAGQYAGAFPGMAPVPPGGEGAYLALSSADRLNRNPYATVTATGDPTVDVTGYFDRFALDLPDYVVIALGTNDIRTRPASAVALVEQMLDAFLPQLLALSPTVRIGLLQHLPAQTEAGAEESRHIGHAIIRACIDRAAADPRVEVIPAYLHQSTEAVPDLAHGEPLPQIARERLSDTATQIAATVTAAWIAWHEAHRSPVDVVPAAAAVPASNRAAILQSASRTDVERLFKLVLRRPPESEAAIAQNVGIPIAVLLEAFLTSDEYRRRAAGDAAERARDNFPGGAVAVGATADQLDALVERTRETWTKLGIDDPYWSVLTNEVFRGKTIDDALEKNFFDSGRGELVAFAAACDRNGVTLPVAGTVVDFGCGVGRVGSHLAQRFANYVGVDLSEAHLAIARRHFAQAQIKNAAFRTLDQFVAMPPAADCFYSLITLQHSAPPIVCALLDLLMGSLKRGGIGYFQMPHALYDYAYAVEDHLAQPNALGEMEIHAVPQRDVFAVIRRADCDLIEALPDGKVGAGGLSTTYLIRKR